MPIDYSAAENFIWSTARLLDRHRYTMLFLNGQAEPVIEALRGYCNPDGGFGHGLEPDLRCPSSQPAPTLYALETLHETGASDHDLVRQALTWIGSISDEHGGVPFALPGYEGYPHAPWWEGGGEDAPREASFLTFAFAAIFWRLGITDNDWLSKATDWSWRSIEEIEEPGGYWLKYALVFLDAVPDSKRAEEAIRSFSRRMDSSMVSPVGAEGEALRPLDLSPCPGTRSRKLVGQVQLEDHLDAVEAQQKDDGGWMFDWVAWSPAQTSDWRGYVTIRALQWLRDNGRI